MEIGWNRIYTETEYHDVKHRTDDEVLKLITAFRARKLSKYIRAEDEVLEFGVGAGWNVLSLPARRRVGYDIAHTYINRLTDNGIDFVSDLNSLPSQSFDVILIAHVLEHLPDDAQTLIDLKRFLRPSGRIVVMVPLEYQRRLWRYSERNKDFHVHAYNVQTSVNLLRSCGYNVQSCTVHSWGFDRFAAKIAARFGSSQLLHRMLVHFCRFLRPEKEIHAVATLGN